ncbi:FAD-binding oxidoreductase [Paralcaligenes sp. KSB-10]|uniref:NAD(P)/FAD-dependent oxidoreductase n=1 Tax=Paralcaligenes sp. KSB-10 TaxID=2901142 RepID=UPI001E589CA1|nr:FAD-binding oxidoreductase [Paralcaligenes sp. KSB-10]UHL62996.1 FAD-binding oxidoreductase [Paralcaligenes sp. KSB-10]
MHAKYLVVGAGYAGLAAARRLAELFPDETIVVLDATRPAENASGRNSGFMIDLPYAKIDSRSSPEQSQWQINLLRSGQRLLRDWVDAHNIECGWSKAGHYKAATSDFGIGQLKAVEATLEKNRIPFRRLAPRQIRSELGSSHYKRAIWLQNCTLVQPAELVNGLIGSLPKNVTVFFDTPVSAISRGSPYTVTANNHEISAEFIFLCANTGLPFFGHAKYRQLTMYTYAGLSRELSDAESAAFGGAAEWGVTPVERLEATSRKIDGRRFMLRAGFSYKHELPTDQVKRHLSGMLLARYPDMPADLFEYVWGGAVSLTRNGDPVYERFGEKIHGVSGCNASGILKMTMLGTLLVDGVFGLDSELLDQTRRFSHPNFIPPDPIRRMAVNMSIRKIRQQMNGS